MAEHRTATYRCCTCNHVGSLAEVSCGHWANCRYFAAAKADGTLPTPFPDIGGGPTEADR